MKKWKETPLKEKIGIITGSIAILIFFYGVVGWIDVRYLHTVIFNAFCEEVKKIEQRLDYKIISDQAQATQERIWTIEDRCAKRKCTDTEKEELRKLKEQQKLIDKKMTIMIEKEVK